LSDFQFPLPRSHTNENAAYVAYIVNLGNYSDCANRTSLCACRPADAVARLEVSWAQWPKVL